MDSDASPFNFANGGETVGATPPPNVPSAQRPRTFRVCYNEEDGEDTETTTGATARNSVDTGPEPWGVAPIQFLYSIQTDIPSASISSKAKYTILSSVSTAVMDSIYESDCPSKQRKRRRRQRALSDDLSSPSFSLRSSSRRMEILSISQGEGHEWLGPCDSDLSSSNTINDNSSEFLSFCNQAEGVVVIGFDEMNYPGTKIGSGAAAYDFKSVGEAVLSRIQTDMANGNYLEKVNSDVLNLGVTVTQMDYIASEYPSLVDQNAFAPLGSRSTAPAGDTGANETNQITLFSKIAIPLMVILAILAMGLCWCAISSWPSDWYFFAKKSANANRGRSEEEEEENPRSKGISRSGVGPKSRRDGNKNASAFNGNGNTPSLEATLQDLTKSEIRKYGDQGAPYSMNKRNRRTYSSLPVDRNRSGANRFLPISANARSKSLIHVIDGSVNPSDTETGSSAQSVGAAIGNGINYGRNSRSSQATSKVHPRNDIHPESISHSSPSSMESSPLGIFSSFLKRSSTIEPPRSQTPVINLRDRVSSYPNNKFEGTQFFHDEEELPPPTRSSDNESSTKNTILSYAVPTDGKCNPLVEVSPSKTTQDALREKPSPRMSAKKSAAYRAYIHQKMQQREENCEQLSEPIPLEIGVKRTFTDERGHIREMVAL